MFLNNHIYCKIQKILLCNFFYIKQIPKLCKSCFCWNCLYSFSLYWLTDEYIWGAFCFTSRIHIMHRLVAHSFKWSHLRLWRLMAGLEEGGWGWPRAPDWLLTLMFVCRSRRLREREREAPASSGSGPEEWSVPHNRGNTQSWDTIKMNHDHMDGNDNKFSFLWVLGIGVWRLGLGLKRVMMC